MIKYLNLIQYFIYSFFFALIISPFVISFIKKEKVKQVILHYVESHKTKSGTPTMGGVIFIITIIILSLICYKNNSLFARVSILIFFLYGLVGFLDDFIKFKFKRNLGLRPYQKIIFQLAISVGVGLFVYYYLGSNILVPFTNITINLGIWIVPVVAIIYLATTNSVNLTDGLDGLAASSTLFYFVSFLVLFLILNSKGVVANVLKSVEEIDNISVLISVSCGAILSFIVFNCFPAKIFMGDTGSLALGSLVASVAVFTGMELYIPILGIVFVASSVSVIIQVAYYKLTKKRIFLMAPLHHHFEKKGVHEVRITLCYMLVTIFAGLITILLNIL